MGNASPNHSNKTQEHKRLGPYDERLDPNKRERGDAASALSLLLLLLLLLQLKLVLLLLLLPTKIVMRIEGTAESPP